MNDPTTYDKAKYHLEGDYPVGMPRSQAYVHTGFYIGWLAENRLLSEEMESDFDSEVRAVRKRELSGPEFYERIGGVFDSTILNDEGRAFTDAYFDFDTGEYLRDYKTLLGHGLPTLYHVANTLANYDRLSTMLDKRFREWRQHRLEAAK